MPPPGESSYERPTLITLKRTRALLLSLLIAACAIACSDDPLTKLLPKIEVEPERLDFGLGTIDRENILALIVRNRGSGDLEIEAVEIAPTGVSVFSVRDVPERVAASAEGSLSAIFVPRLPREVDEAMLVIHSNDPKRPEVGVPLTGIGGARELEVLPSEIDFGTVNEGTAPRRAIEIKNIGGDALEISDVTWTSTSSDLGLVLGTFHAGRIEAGTSTVVEVVFAPADLGADRGVVTIRSNDEDEPVVEVPARARANLAPRALAWGCDAPESVGGVGCDGAPPLRTLTAGFRKRVGLDGRMSFDPEGTPIAEYTWRIIARPPESNAVVFHSTDDRVMRARATGEIEVDRVGRYDLRLVVKDERGLESLDRPESHVLIVPRDLEVLLRWDIATDVDLHVVRPNGMAGDYGSGFARTSTGSDCSAFNRAPNWNDLLTDRDDPSLDKDDVTGRGPEIVSLDLPEDGGVYRVFAHDCDSRETHAPVNVVVEVYVRGELIRTVPSLGTSYTLAPGELWEAARVAWDASGPRAVVEDRSQDAPVQAPGLCLSR